MPLPGKQREQFVSAANFYDGLKDRSNSAVHLRQSQSGIKPNMPNEQSISRHQNGMPRQSPNTSAYGITSPQANQAKVEQPPVTDGSRTRRRKQCDDEMPKRQPVRAIEKKWMLRLRLRQRIANLHKASAPIPRNRRLVQTKFTNRFNSPSNGIAVAPLKTSPTMNSQVSHLIRWRRTRSRFMRRVMKIILA